MRRMFSQVQLLSLFCAMFAIGLGGCVIVVDEDEPITQLSVDLVWEAGGGTYGSCEDANVNSMDYELFDLITGESVIAGSDLCSAQILFDDLLPGEYELVLNGYREDTLFWSSICAGLFVEDGIDNFFECAVPFS